MTGAGAKQQAEQKNQQTDGCNHHKGGKFLTFFLGEEEYGLEILKVHEIIGMMDITLVPRTPDFIRGVVNLRGKVIPIVDLRLKFGMESIERTEETCIIVVQAAGIQMGIVVDKVSEVLDIVGEDIEDALSFGAEINTDYILGIGKSENRVKLLLDIDKVLSDEDAEHICQASAASGKREASRESEVESQVEEETEKRQNSKKKSKKKDEPCLGQEQLEIF